MHDQDRLGTLHGDQFKKGGDIRRGGEEVLAELGGENGRVAYGVKKQGPPTTRLSKYCSHQRGYK